MNKYIVTMIDGSQVCIEDEIGLQELAENMVKDAGFHVGETCNEIIFTRHVVRIKQVQGF